MEGRQGAHWGELGFQGHDPATDFRGGGLLSLLVMLRLAENDRKFVESVLLEASPETHPTSWYMYAVASINFTGDLCERMRKGQLNHRFYELDKVALPASLKDYVGHPAVLAICRAHDTVFRAFHAKWVRDRPHTMEFNQFKEELYKEVYPKL
eukprot:NODE_4830_length_624_cov_47.264348_g4157_i0.p1 GENE.NODE_4830_length_624_cov_47.264348_g4157_i0~~NODE_4830_length_624_cov_47.264348_g4157_i0.p1  ORF type:complete len:153 (+),score=39.38 NODE_4830_length_624_cov_47.264348_g4157_i0:80-538(+)